MLSYRHAFHAGNHADVLKHLILMLVCQYTNQKDKPYWYIDTHAGAGMYQLTSTYASKNAEFRSGIEILWKNTQTNALLKAFVDLIAQFNPQQDLSFYPGSPNIAHTLLRQDDKMRLFELHPTDFPILDSNFSGMDKRVKVLQDDGFAGIKAFLPPPTRRAVVLIDPPYEDKQDYQRVVMSIEDSLKRFATGCYLVWYPLLQRDEPEKMRLQLQKLPVKWLDIHLEVHAPRADGYGMHGSGMFVINPPWTLAAQLDSCMPELTRQLAQDHHAYFALAQQE